MNKARRSAGLVGMEVEGAAEGASGGGGGRGLAAGTGTATTDAGGGDASVPDGGVKGPDTGRTAETGQGEKESGTVTGGGPGEPKG